MKLYELSQSMNELMDMIESGVEGLEDTLESLEVTFDEKVENCMKAYRNISGQRDICKTEAQRLTQRAAAFDKQAETLKLYVENEMKRVGKDKIKLAMFTIWLQENNASVAVTQEEMIPEQFWKTPAPLLDKQLIKEKLDEGFPVPGAELKRTKSLRMR